MSTFAPPVRESTPVVSDQVYTNSILLVYLVNFGYC